MSNGLLTSAYEFDEIRNGHRFSKIEPLDHANVEPFDDARLIFGFNTFNDDVVVHLANLSPQVIEA